MVKHFFFLYLNKIVDFFPNLRKIWSRDTGKGEQISEKMKVDSVWACIVLHHAGRQLMIHEVEVWHTTENEEESIALKSKIQSLNERHYLQKYWTTEGNVMY